MLGVFHGGADWRGGAQLDPRLSLGGKRSGTRVAVYSPRVVAGLRGVRVVALGPGCGVGLGQLRSVGDDGLQWTPPGGTAGDVVTVPANARAVVHGGDNDFQYVEVERLDALPLGGAMVVQSVEVFNNALGGRDFTEAENTSGVTQYGAVFLKNEGDTTIASLKAWVDSSSDAGFSVGLEAVDGNGDVPLPADDTTAPTGITWTALTTEAGSVEVTGLAAGAAVCLRWKRVLAADNGGTARLANRAVLSVDGEELTLGGLCRVKEGEGVYVVLLKEGERPVYPDDLAWFGDAGDFEVTGLALATGTVYVHALQISGYGVLGPVTETVLTIDADGEQVENPPQPPEVAGVVSIADGGVLVTALYDPAREGEPEEVDARRANAWTVRLTSDGTDPAGVDPVYVAMEATEGTALEALAYESGAILDGAPVRVLVGVERDLSWPGWTATVTLNGAQVVPPGSSGYTGTGVFSFLGPDLVQLVITHTVPLANTGDIELWSGAVGVNGTLVRRLGSANTTLTMTLTRAEFVEYTATAHYLVVVNTAGDDIRGDIVVTAPELAGYEGSGVETTCTHKISGVGRVKARAFAGAEGVEFAPAVGESDTEVIDAGKGIELVYGPGSLELWGNGVLCMRLVWRGYGHADNGVYIPTGFEVRIGTYTGGDAGETDVVGFDAWDGSNKEVVLRARGENLAVWDVETMVVKLNSVAVSAAGMSSGSYGGEQGAYARYAESLVSVFDPENEGALGLVSLAALTGAMAMRGKWDFGKDEAGVLAV